MTWLSLGSMALPFQLRNQGVQMRADIARLGQELTTGQVQDPSRHLRGQVGPLATLSADLARTDRRLLNAKSATIRADMVQNALSAADQLRAGTAQSLLTAGAEWSPGDSLSVVGNAARAALADTLSALSARAGGAALFSGDMTDRVPLVSTEEILDALAPVVAGLPSGDAVAQAVEAEFLTPGGLFDTLFYRGGTASPGPQMADGQATPALPTAADPAIRSLLAGLATAALLSDPLPDLSVTEQRAMALRAGDRLLGSAGGIGGLQARVGSLQSTLETRQTQLLARRDTLETGRASLIATDPYETATRLQDTQARLDALYTVTARVARLSLTGYLR